MNVIVWLLLSVLVVLAVIQTTSGDVWVSEKDVRIITQKEDTYQVLYRELNREKSLVQMVIIKEDNGLKVKKYYKTGKILTDTHYWE